MRKIKHNPFAVEVCFDGYEMHHILQWARHRQSTKANSQDKRIIPRDDIETHQLGIMGELAFKKVTNGEIDLNSYAGGDDGKDSEIYGVTIEVKTLQGYLTFRELSDFTADVAVLVIHNGVHNHKVSVEGWITRQVFQANHFIDNFGYGDRPCMQPNDLHPIVNLKTYCLTTRHMRGILELIYGQR